MPKVNGDLWKTCRDELDLTSDQAAARLKITGGYLRNVERGYDLPSARLVHRAARLYGRTYEALTAANNDGVPDEPPTQPTKDPTAPPKRDEKAGQGPARVDQRAAS